jgi:hypothetical protein
VAAALLAAGPFFLAAPSAMVRQVFFFQMLRASDGLVDVPARIADLSATYANALTPLFASLGIIAASFVLLRGTLSGGAGTLLPVGPWRVVTLWTFFSLLLFTYSRSFYAHYYIQLAAPLCLLGSGVSFIPQIVRRLFAGPTGTAPEGSTDARRVTPAVAIAIGFLLFLSLPLAAVQWNGVTARIEDRIFEIVGRYISDAVPPGTPVLTTDEQFNFLGARPPSRNATGFLVDSYGHLIYLGLGLDTRDWGDLISSVLTGRNGGSDPDPIMHRPVPQADLLQRALSVPLLAIHDKGLRRFTSATLDEIRARSQLAEEQRRYMIYRVPPPAEP